MAPVDVVVVGAGSAGAALAARLSQRPRTSVLLLEAGPDHPAAGAPAGVQGANFFAAIGTPGRIWPNLVATRSASQAPSLYLRGLGVGGSSTVNAMCAIRGTQDDYDRWEHELGCPGWGWPAMHEAFLRVEDDIDYGGDGWHGRGGPIPLTRTPRDRLCPLDLALESAMTALGYETCDDYHAPGATGVSRSALTMRNGHRVSTNDAYLERVRGRDSIEVRGDVLVDRVLFEGRRAVGVRTAGGEEIEARQVVVSAGAIHSPAILLRSGVGVDDGLPVGRNLRDHASTPGFELALRPEARMTSVEGPVFTSMLRYTSGIAGAGPNDMQMVWFGSVGTDDDGLCGGRLLGAVMRVFSHGGVRLAGPDPTLDPIVEFRMLSDSRDLVRLRDCVHRMVDVVRQPAVAAVTDSVVALTTPLDELQDDEAIDAWLRTTVCDYVHAVGTCRMGTPGDPAAVVDPALRVIGYDNLRVCDASVMPDVPKANTHLTTVAIAERLVSLMDAPPEFP